VSVGDLATLAAIKAFARGKRWQVDCATCGKERLCLDVSDLGRTLLDHSHAGEVSLTIKAAR
jgi:hypothetical protein